MKNGFEIRGNVAAILLHRNDGAIFETTIDFNDLEKAAEFPNTWYASWNPPTQSFYVYGKLPAVSGRRQTVQLHRWLAGASHTQQVDHINLDTLDNRRSNLRLASPAENAQNKKVQRRNNKSGYRGVSWCSTNQKWIAQVMVGRKNKFIGYFSNKHEAGKKVASARATLMPFSREAL
ncbi:HNH endonuclease [Paenibacillus koleovorans]|uniref:HNH endonuclease n=1 Tax=Paenibacillus koleovorans TaxID=121608 RepID=UPI000FDA6C51|nr:HNH endonuclease [Paenibacillus koleovorans]